MIHFYCYHCKRVFLLVVRLVWLLGCQATLELFHTMAASPKCLITLRSAMHTMFAIFSGMCWRCLSCVPVNTLLDFVATSHCLHVCAMTVDCDPQQKHEMQRLFRQTVTGAVGCLTGVVHAFLSSVVHCSWTLVASLVRLAIQVWIDHDRQQRIAHALLGNRCIEVLSVWMSRSSIAGAELLVLDVDFYCSMQM